jgi:hypothetical protein
MTGRYRQPPLDSAALLHGEEVACSSPAEVFHAWLSGMQRSPSLRGSERREHFANTGLVDLPPGGQNLGLGGALLGPDALLDDVDVVAFR